MNTWDELFITSGLLGCCGAGYIIYLFVWFPALRTHLRELLFNVSVCNFGLSAYYCLYLGAALGTPWICRLHTAFGYYVSVASCMWTAALTVDTLLTVLHRGKPELSVYHAVGWGVPAVAAVPYLLLPVEFPPADRQQGWFTCLRVPPLLPFLTYEVPLVLCWLVIAASCVGILRHIWRVPYVGGDGALRQLQLKFTLIPLVFLLVRIGGLLDLFTDFWQVPAPDWLLHLRGATEPLQGFFNAILFGVLSAGVRREVGGHQYQKLVSGNSSPINSYDTFPAKPLTKLEEVDLTAVHCESEGDDEDDDEAEEYVY